MVHSALAPQVSRLESLPVNDTDRVPPCHLWMTSENKMPDVTANWHGWVTLQLLTSKSACQWQRLSLLTWCEPKDYMTLNGLSIMRSSVIYETVTITCPPSDDGLNAGSMPRCRKTPGGGCRGLVSSMLQFPTIVRMVSDKSWETLLKYREIMWVLRKVAIQKLYYGTKINL
jgi:hypothetical protein